MSYFARKTIGGTNQITLAAVIICDAVKIK